ncbi:TolC family protein [Ferrovibrio sp.]|jgi:hypothetical protein|uniref:TolC family protein n=1 Tax=Ferrovibrio sp. TaxID=1917215 RepID=UPI0035B3C50B
MHRIAPGLALLLLLGACAGPVADRAFEDIATQTERQIGQRPVWIRSEADEQAVRAALDRLLAKPISADDAVQIALLNNRRLQSRLSELGIGAADLTASWRPANPGIGFSRLHRSGEVEIERSFSIDALSLLALPLRAGIEARQFERTKLQTAGEILTLAAQTKRAWYEAVAAEQTARYIETMRESASVQAELAKRMYQAGNWGMLDYAREQLFYADATARLARSRVSATAAREKLARLMGLWGDDLRFTLPERLPVLPAKPREARNIEAETIAGRLDVKQAQAELEAVRKAYGLTNALRFVNVLETGFVRKSEEGRSDKVGYEIRLEVPIFDFGDAKATKAEQTWRQAVNRLTDTAVDARSAARETWLTYRTAHDLALHYQTEILPLRQKIGEEMALRYNGMLVSVFDLLADAREQIAEVTAALEAQRDFWLADTDLTFVTLAATRTGS